MAPSTSYLAVLKASYDYEPQSEEEIAIKEDQILYLIERTDDDWWKVKAKDADENDEGGLVPAAYVEQAEHKSVVKVLYDYDATAPGELSVKEDDLLFAFGGEEDWLLVQKQDESGGAGFVPANYVEETSDAGGGDEEPAALAAPAIVVPPSPPRPTAPYVDPAERVASTRSLAQVDAVQTWAVSEVDKKGKKKKGTLGIGSGAIFFASESDKTPVQKWQTSNVESSRIDKSKHVHIEIGGASTTSLHFNAGSKDVAEAIIAKLESSKRASSSSPPPASPPPAAGFEPETLEDSEPDTDRDSPKPRKNGISVHFATTPPSIISPREPSEDEGEHEDAYHHTQDVHAKHDDGHEWVTVLYDFNADGEDELTVHEGDRLIVLEKDGDEWWKVRDGEGNEGVVPASYVELEEQSGTVASLRPTTNGIHSDEEDAAREAAEREKQEAEERERQETEARQQREERERTRVEAERKAKAAAEAAEAERKRKEREREREREKKEKEEAERRAQDEQKAERERAATRPANKSGSRSKPTDEQKAASPSREGLSKARPSSDSKTRGGPSPQRVRTWHDRTGQFKVDAEFLGFSNGKLRLHKVNGVVIEVPAEKMSPEDMRYIEAVTNKKKEGRSARAASPGGSDDEPLATRRKSLQPEPRSTAKPVPPKKGPAIDWFEFFLNAGCDVDDCTRYATSFERDKIDDSILPDITDQTMRSLGLREGDIIRVKKAISQRVASSSGGKSNAALEEQMRRDEELARRLQEEESGGRASPRRQPAAPNLFAGPGGTLKNNTRRGRPQPSRSTPPATVDLQSITSASEQINRQGSPIINLTASPTGVTGPPRASSAAPATSGFDDDAWTNRPSSTRPLAPTPPAVAARAPSAPPQTTPAAAASPPAPPAPTPIQTDTKPSLAKTTESDVFEQLARLSALKTQTPAAASPSPASAPISPPLINTPVSFQNGLGMGSSPVPIGQLQGQATGFPGLNNGGPRGPFAPVPSNQGLLQPLVPTSTGFNGFVPTRPASNSPAYNQQPPLQPSFLSTQPTGFGTPQQIGFLASQPTGFPGAIAPQPTGFAPSGPLMSQTTSYPGALGSGPFAGGRQFGALQPNATGFNPSFGQLNSPSPIPPVPPLPSNNVNKDTSPANIFAQMKQGTFGNDNAPQPSDKYDSLRPQPTGWGVQGTVTGYQNGYSGPFY